MKNVIRTIMMTSAIVLFINACKEETPKPADNNNNGGGGNTEQYILMNGLRVSNKNPNPSTISLVSGDTCFNWKGNTHSTLNGDSFIRVEHLGGKGIKRIGSIVDENATEYGEVYIAITYGQTAAATSVRLTAGDYKVEKVNGVWYAVLKNGVGKGTKGSTAVNYTGLEFRFALPSTFK